MRRLFACLTLCASLCHAQESYDRLAATVKLWNYVKYLHPRATSPGVDWNTAFAKAAPKVLSAGSDQEMSAAVDEMLAALKDPATHIADPSRDRFGDYSRSMPTIQSDRNGVALVTMERGSAAGQLEFLQARNQFMQRLAKVGAVVFDLRGARNLSALPLSLPLPKSINGPSLMRRQHSGYAPPDGAVSSGGYKSTWDMEFAASWSAGAMRPVFLVNSNTSLPLIALAAQESGAGAIVSEDPLREEQVELRSMFPVMGNVRAWIRTKEIMYPDGTTGVVANAILNKTGDDALNAAMDFARSGTWPAVAGRAKLNLPPAGVPEKLEVPPPTYPALEDRLRAAATVWGVFHYFHPYRYLYDDDWDAVLREVLPKVAHTENSRAYHLAVAGMVAHVRDTHCFVSSAELSGFYGAAPAGVEVRWIEGRPVITRVVDDALQTTVKPGDVLIAIDGQPYQSRVDELTPEIAASTPQSMRNRVAQILLNGEANSSVTVTLAAADGKQYDARIVRSQRFRAMLNPYRNGEIFRLLTPKIGYVDLERLPGGQVDAMFQAFAGTEAIIMDMRGYPQGTAWSIAPRLSEKSAPVAAQFRRNLVRSDNGEGGDIASFLFEQRIPRTNAMRYKGKTVMLIDERAISQSEHSGLFYKAANGTVFIGSPTAGANGDVTSFSVPGGIRIGFSGHDVRWPDGKQLQRAGLEPNVLISPTVAGIRAGRDEVLERAVSYLEKGK